jgi:5'-3' exonuclease
VGAPGYEADDVIGTLATRAEQPVEVVTGDRDLFQLVDDERRVRVLYTARGVGRHERVTDDWVVAKYGVRARQYADFATLRGDASDGLPGVAGIGEKTAATLLQRYGDMAGIRAAALDPDSGMGPGPRSKIKAAADYLEVAPRVVAVARDLDLGAPDTALPREPRDLRRVAELGERWGIESPVRRLTEVLCS